MSTKSQRQLKQAYKQVKPQGGVFQVLNTTTGMVLIDDALNIDAKWNRHQAELRFGSHRNSKLQADWKQFGADQFKFSILAALEPDDDQQSSAALALKALRSLVEEETSVASDQRY